MVRKSYLLVGMISASSALLVAHCGKCVEDSCPACSIAIDPAGHPEIMVEKRTPPHCTCKENCSCKKMNCSLCINKKCPCLLSKAILKTPSNQINLKVGKKEIIKLSANPSTGYHWEMKSTKQTKRAQAATIAMLEIEYPEKRMMGTPGLQPIEITGVRPGSMKLTLEYKGPGKNTKTSKTETYTIIVSKK